MATAVAVGKGGRVLVVDDEPMVRETLGRVLTDEGYLVDLAVDGSDALARVLLARPDAILLDLMMPNMNGRQFLQALRDDPDLNAIPVLIMTAVHGLEVNLASIGASDIVEKPFDVDELLNKVALAVYRSRDADTPAPLHIPMEPLAEPVDHGVVLVVEHDRTQLQRLDVLLSERGYTVVSMTRALVQLARLARALRPRAILLELTSENVHDTIRELRAERDMHIPILVFARGSVDDARGEAVVERATDEQLVAFVERQR